MVKHAFPLNADAAPVIFTPEYGYNTRDPIFVLDFKSLYPSIIIAYNLCYTTLLHTEDEQAMDGHQARERRAISLHLIVITPLVCSLRVFLSHAKLLFSGLSLERSLLRISLPG